MPLELDFAGWFQVRLATDPDPHDEPHGISGYTWSLPGEPDFDRRIRFQPSGTVSRVACAPEIEVGVTVRRVSLNGSEVGDHPLQGVAVDLAGDPVFEGRNGVVAGNGLEPIVPFRIQFAHPGGIFGRSFADAYHFPYPELRGKGIDFSDEAKEEVAAVTGITDLVALWHERAGRLAEIAAVTTDEELSAACAYRIDFLRTQDFLGGDFGLIVRYGMNLSGSAEGCDLLAGTTSVDPNTPWPIKFWMGAWDFDALCAFVHGTLTIPEA